MTPVQVRMARAALGISVDDLSRDAMVPPGEIAALEESGGSPDAAAKLRATFELAGVEFLDEDGVRCRPSAASMARTVPLENLSSANDE